MIIKTLGIKSFGKYHEKRIDLQPGINLIYGDNESGKTTIQRFIKGMFFGFYKPYIKRRSYTTDYEKYYPWNAANYRGSISLVIKDKKYRIERNFIKNQESIKLIDMQTGEDLTSRCTYDQHIKMYLPLSLVSDISEHYFNNVLNVQQLSIEPDKKFSEELKDYYQRLSQKQDKKISISGILRSLENKENEIGSDTRKKSPLGQLKEQINHLNLEFNRWSEMNQENNDIQLRVNELTLHKNDLEKQIQEQQSYGYDKQEKINLDNANKIKKFKQEISELKQKLDEHKYYEQLSEATLNEAYDLYRENNDLKRERENLKEIKNLYSQQEPVKTEKKAYMLHRFSSPILLILFLVSLILAIKIHTSFYILAGLSGLLMLFFLEKRISNNSITTPNMQKNSLMEVRQQILAMDKKIIELENRQLTLPLLIDSDEEYYALRDGINEFKQLKLLLNDKEECLELIQDKLPIEKYITVDQDLLEKVESINIELSRLSERQHLLTHRVRSIEEIEGDLEQKKKKLASLELEKQAIIKSKRVIEELNERMNEDYRVLLRDKLSNHLARLTKGKYSDVKVGEDLRLMVYDKDIDQIIDAEMLSSGTKDLMYLALRLSILELGTKHVPLIFDDTFVQLDDHRLEDYLQILKKVSINNQIILFTCQRREKMILENLKIPFNYITL